LIAILLIDGRGKADRLPHLGKKTPSTTHSSIERVVDGVASRGYLRAYACPRSTFSAMLWLTGMYFSNCIVKLARPLVIERRSVA